MLIVLHPNFSFEFGIAVILIINGSCAFVLFIQYASASTFCAGNIIIITHALYNLPPCSYKSFFFIKWQTLQLRQGQMSALGLRPHEKTITI